MVLKESETSESPFSLVLSRAWVTHIWSMGRCGPPGKSPPRSHATGLLCSSTSCFPSTRNCPSSLPSITQQWLCRDGESPVAQRSCDEQEHIIPTSPQRWEKKKCKGFHLKRKTKKEICSIPMQASLICFTDFFWEVHVISSLAQTWQKLP